MSSPIKIKGVKLNDGVTVLADGFYPTATNKVAFADVTENGGANDTTLTAALSGKANASHTHTKSQITDFAHTHQSITNGEASIQMQFPEEVATIRFDATDIVGTATTNNLSSTATTEKKIPTSGAIKTALNDKADVSALSGKADITSGGIITPPSTSDGLTLQSYTTNPTVTVKLDHDGGKITLNATAEDDVYVDGTAVVAPNGMLESGSTKLVTAGAVYSELTAKADTSSVYTKSAIDTALDAKEDVSNKIDSWSSLISGNDQYPSAQLINTSLVTKVNSTLHTVLSGPIDLDTLTQGDTYYFDNSAEEPMTDVFISSLSKPIHMHQGYAGSEGKIIIFRVFEHHSEYFVEIAGLYEA